MGTASGIRRSLCLSLALSTLVVASACRGAEDMTEARNRMLEEIRHSVRSSSDYTGYDTLSEAVMSAMAQVPREAFVPSAHRHLAYQNSPLPIEAGQTISQPLIVALMTELLQPQPGDVIL